MTVMSRRQVLRTAGMGSLAVGGTVVLAACSDAQVETKEVPVKTVAETICSAGVKKCEVMTAPKVPLMFNAMADDVTSSHEEALLRIYQRLRPGYRAGRLLPQLQGVGGGGVCL